MLKNIFKVTGSFLKFNRELLSQDLKDLTARQLVGLFRKFYDKFGLMSAWSVPFAFTEYGTPLWSNSLLEYINSKKLSVGMSVQEVYQLLVDTNKKTFTALEKESLLRLATMVVKSKGLKKVFNQPISQMKKILQSDYPLFYKYLHTHYVSFKWINFGFEGPVLDEFYFLSVIKDWVFNKKPVEETVKRKKYLASLKSRQNQLIKKLNIDKEHQWMLWVVREFSYQKAYRKDVEYHSYYTYDFLLAELARRFGMAVDQAHYLLMPEIKDILLGKKKVNINELNKRMENNFYVVVKGKPKLLVGQSAARFVKLIKKRDKSNNTNNLSGQCACPGKYKGRIKVIKNKSDYTKFKKGDILVSYATNPNMVSLMKMAGAIITDEGGVTCHAAIVSRELGVPCVIGTRFATQVFKDNDLVEVDAVKGTVKKI
ncbi:hypothetical protein KKC17_03155 [Patescibacteria group bacterium]|nr:hypothetical protein [Patescibacteria group bacterium]